MSKGTPTPSVSCCVQQSGHRQASPCLDVVKPPYSWPIMTSRSLYKPCHHTVFNTVLRMPHDVAKVSYFARFNMTEQLFVSLCKCIDLFSGQNFIQHPDTLVFKILDRGYIVLPCSSTSTSTCCYRPDQDTL